MNNIHAEVDEIFRMNNKKAVVSLFLSMQGNYIRATEAEAKLAEARAEIENLKWHINSEKAKAEAALALNDRALELVSEARAEIERKDKLIEQMRESLRLALSEARSTHCEQTILAALAAERSE